jgi:hypothetical protein
VEKEFNMADTTKYSNYVNPRITALWVDVGRTDEYEKDGTYDRPFKTLTDALSHASTTYNTIFMLPGSYAEAAMIDWPDITGLSVIGLGDVIISNADAAAAVIDVHPTFTASTMEITLKDITIEHHAQIGIRVDNAHMTKKLNIYMDGVEFGQTDSGDSIDVVDTVTTQAIRIYAKNCSFEGLFHITGGNAGERYRFRNCDLIGGITMATAVAYEVTLIGCIILTDGVSQDNAVSYSTIGCVYATNADPAVYTQCAEHLDT